MVIESMVRLREGNGETEFYEWVVDVRIRGCRADMCCSSHVSVVWCDFLVVWCFDWNEVLLYLWEEKEIIEGWREWFSKILFYTRG